MSSAEEIRKLILNSGFIQAGFLPKEKRVLMPEVIDMCAKNTCRQYGTNWCCPPAHGSLEDCAARVAGYETMILFSYKGELEDSLDYEGMIKAAEDFRLLVDVLHDKLKPLLPKFELLANGGCHRCEKCTYPDAPCRFPDKMHPSLEGTGFMVSTIAKDAGIRYINGKDTITYFGAVLF